MEKWIDSQVFAPIDYFFAKTILSLYKEKTHGVFLAYLLAMGRSGHLCVEVSEGKVTPSPSFLTEDPELAMILEKELVEFFPSIPSSFCHKISKGNSLPKVPLYLWENRLYFQRNWELEESFLFHLERIQKGHLQKTITSPQFNKMLNNEQITAVTKALESPISLISGGPGTGKTFTAIEIVSSFLLAFPEEKRKKLRIKLAAPTGKAAAILEKNIMERLSGLFSNIECGTIHSFLKMGSYEEGKSLFADLFLIDESSMLDAKLFVQFLEGLQTGGRVIFMGDKDQLPPVEAGGFFSDLIAVSEEIALPVTLLKKSLRVEKQELQDLAEALLSVDVERVKEQEGVEILPKNSLSAVRERVWMECKSAFSFFMKECSETNLLDALKKVEKFRVLSCMRKGFLGVDHLNRMVLERFLSELQEDQFLVCPILITANDTARQLMNGDIGFLCAKASSLKRSLYQSCDRAFFLNKEDSADLIKFREISATILPSFEFAYCLSVHKSQGSEYESVLVLAPSGSERLGKEVLYTAVTRAKKKVKVLIEENTLVSLLGKSSKKISGVQKKLSGKGILFR